MLRPTETVSRLLPTPIGDVHVVANDVGVVAVQRVDAAKPPRLEAPRCLGAHPILDLAGAELTEYFEGHRQHFTVPLAPTGTPFQRDVWSALGTIPFGESRSYAWLAKEIGRPRAVRAVGAANGRNPLAIIVPCHRVIGSAGALVGYAGGLEMKRWLLEHESGVPRTAQQSLFG
ncbi:MAG TPA: methylated-DNA--[protein]-cysteine S-methyltransferase [Myxococcaceae bacterium]|nr:methylated-DNA--[protein]-cysteine S-methyltransferase [Myxococcaceae bacterium]